MSNEIEMKRLADVESVETVSDEASVLIVQDGEVKQTAKSNVGGAGGGVVWMHAADLKIYHGKTGEGGEQMKISEFLDAFENSRFICDKCNYSGVALVTGYSINSYNGGIDPIVGKNTFSGFEFAEE